MKGYVYVDTEMNLNIRDYTFIQDNPGFFGENRDFILAYWDYDTEDLPKMIYLLGRFGKNGYNIHNAKVLDFMRAVKFDPDTLKEYKTNDSKIR